MKNPFVLVASAQEEAPEVIEMCLAIIALILSALRIEGPVAAAAGGSLELWVVALVGGVALVILVMAGVLAYREWHHEHPE